MESERAENTEGGEQDITDKLRVVDKLCLVLEYCPQGSLYDCLIKRRQKVRRKQLFVISLFICSFFFSFIDSYCYSHQNGT